MALYHEILAYLKPMLLMVVCQPLAGCITGTWKIVHVYVYVHIHIHVYIYIYTHTHNIHMDTTLNVIR